jgi:hypothetical protein
MRKMEIKICVQDTVCMGDGCMPTHRGVSSERTRSNLDSDDTMLAILRASADLERLFFYKLYFEGGTSLDVMERWTLGKYIDEARKLNFIEQDSYAFLKKFSKLRNDVVHISYLIDRIENDQELLEKVKALIIQVCDFTDKTRIITNSMEKENKLSKFYMTKEKDLLL